MLMLDIILLVMLVLILTTLIVIFSSSNIDILKTLMIQTAFTVAEVFVFLVYYTLQGALANAELELHK